MVIGLSLALAPPMFQSGYCCETATKVKKLQPADFQGFLLRLVRVTWLTGQLSVPSHSKSALLYFGPHKACGKMMGEIG